MKLKLLVCLSVVLLNTLLVRPNEIAPVQASTTLRGSLAMIIGERPITVSEILGSLYKVAVNKATPEQELLFGHLTVFVDSLTVLKNSMQKEKSGFYADMLNGLMGESDAQKRIAARSVDIFLKTYIEQQALGWAQEKKPDGTPLYSQEQIAKFKTTAITARIKRIITGEATRVEKIAFWLIVTCKNIVSKIRSWVGGSNLGGRTEISTLTAVVSETLSDRVLQFKEGSRQLLNALTDKTAQAQEFVIEQTQKGLKATVDGVDYLLSKTKEGSSFIIQATIDGKSYILEQAAQAQNFALSLVGLNGTAQLLEKIALTESSQIETTAIEQMTSLSITQKTINAVNEKMTELANASKATAQKMITDISDHVTTTQTNVKETLAQAQKTLEATWSESYKQARSTIATVSDAWTGFTTVLSMVITDPSILFSNQSVGVMQLATTAHTEEQDSHDKFFDSVEFQTGTLSQMLESKTLEKASFDEFAQELGTTMESLEQKLKTEFSQNTTKAILEIIENRVEATTLRKIPPTDFKKFTPTVQEQIFEAWKSATPEELLSIDKDHYELFPEEILTKINEAHDLQKSPAENSLKSKLINEMLNFQKPESINPTEDISPSEINENEDEVFEDVLDTGILDLHETSVTPKSTITSEKPFTESQQRATELRLEEENKIRLQEQEHTHRIQKEAEARRATELRKQKAKDQSRIKEIEQSK